MFTLGHLKLENDIACSSCLNTTQEKPPTSCQAGRSDLELDGFAVLEAACCEVLVERGRIRSTKRVNSVNRQILAFQR